MQTVKVVVTDWMRLKIFALTITTTQNIWLAPTVPFPSSDGYPG